MCNTKKNAVMIDLTRLDTITPTEYSRYLYINRLLKSIEGKVATACDVGCGAGNLLAVLNNHHIRSMGIDLSPEIIKEAKKKLASIDIRIEMRNVYDLSDTVDLVYLSEVLEHMEDDRKLLEFLHTRIVNKDGYLILTVPAHRFLYSIFDKNAGHIRRYEKRALRELLERCGFKPIVFWSYGSILFHVAANIPFIVKRNECKTVDPQKRTAESGIRRFSSIARFFVGRVNIIHRFFFLLDYMCRNYDTGIEYCVLCKSQ